MTEPKIEDVVLEVSSVSLHAICSYVRAGAWSLFEQACEHVR
jgi:hypothetical protein